MKNVLIQWVAAHLNSLQGSIDPVLDDPRNSLIAQSNSIWSFEPDKWNWEWMKWLDIVCRCWLIVCFHTVRFSTSWFPPSTLKSLSIESESPQWWPPTKLQIYCNLIRVEFFKVVRALSYYSFCSVFQKSHIRALASNNLSSRYIYHPVILIEYISWSSILYTLLIKFFNRDIFSLSLFPSFI